MMPHAQRSKGGRVPKKAKQVSGDKAKVKKLNELKKVTKQLDKLTGFVQPKRTAKEKKIDKLWDKKTKLKQQLGIEL